MGKTVVNRANADKSKAGKIEDSRAVNVPESSFMPEKHGMEKKEDGLVLIKNKSKANKSVIATTGHVIEFNSDGEARVLKKDADYLICFKGYEI